MGWWILENKARLHANQIPPPWWHESNLIAIYSPKCIACVEARFGWCRDVFEGCAFSRRGQEAAAIHIFNASLLRRNKMEQSLYWSTVGKVQALRFFLFSLEAACGERTWQQLLRWLETGFDVRWIWLRVRLLISFAGKYSIFLLLSFLCREWSRLIVKV